METEQSFKSTLLHFKGCFHKFIHREIYQKFKSKMMFEWSKSVDLNTALSISYIFPPKLKHFGTFLHRKCLICVIKAPLFANFYYDFEFYAYFFVSDFPVTWLMCSSDGPMRLSDMQ